MRIKSTISQFNFRSFNSTSKVRLDEKFGSSMFKPDTALPNVK